MANIETKYISLKKEHINEFVPAVAVVFAVISGLLFGGLYMIQQHQEKQKSVQKQENKAVDMKQTFNSTNLFNQKQR